MPIEKAKPSWRVKSRRLTESIVLLNNWTPQRHKEFLAIAIAGEVGELCNLIKKEMRGDVISGSMIRMEIADIYIYLCHMADAYGVDLNYQAWLKMKEVYKRPLIQKAMKDAENKRRRLANARRKR